MSGQILPDNRRFGVLWMGEKHLAAALNSTNAFNGALIRLERGANGQDVIDRIDTMLERYGGRGATPRSDQISDRFPEKELAPVRKMTGIFPPSFPRGGPIPPNRSTPSHTHTSVPPKAG